MKILAHAQPADLSGQLIEVLPLLQGVPAFALLPEQALAGLVSTMRRELFPPGKVIVSEGEGGDCLYLITQGCAEVTTMGADGPMVLATLTVGEIFGELALLAPSRLRQATVTALTPLSTLVLTAQTFAAIISAHAGTKELVEASARAMMTAKFIKRATPFARVDAKKASLLAARLAQRCVPADTVILRQGEKGDECYLLRSGTVEVTTVGEEETEKRLTTLGAGALFGEASLLTDSPRNATIRALEPCELIVLKRADLIEVMSADRQVSVRMIELLRLRERPKRASGIVAQSQTMADGETVTILKDPRCGAYFRLSPEGWFLWQRLDGEETLKDLTLDYLDAFKVFAPYNIAGILEGLGNAGFLDRQALRQDVAAAAFHLSWQQQTLILVRRMVEGQIVLNHVDRIVTLLYRRGFRFIYTWPGRIMMGGVALAGVIIFLANSTHWQGALDVLRSGVVSFWLLIPAYLLAVAVHEAGHAFTVKSFGREVPRVGIGWYWFCPIAFVDTSDMWLETSRSRIAVSLAGSYANMILAGGALLACFYVTDPLIIAGLWQFALLSYLMVLLNLNPLLEFDGYYILIDLLDRPNLRQKALAWLGNELPGALRTSKSWRGHTLELLYGIGSLAYIALMSLLTVFLYRTFLQEIVSGFLPPVIAAALAWLAAGAVAAGALLLVAGEIAAKRMENQL